MKNIVEICKEFGLEIPEDKKTDFTKAVTENYVTKAEHDKKIGKAESERDNWKEKAESAEETLKGFEGVDIETVNAEIDKWKTKAEELEADYKTKLAERDFNDALKAEFESIKFTSESAKKAIMKEVKEAGLKVKDGKILGLNDLIGQLKESDASAFVDETQEKHETNKAKFTDKKTTGSGQAQTKEQIMAIKDRSERRAAIAENMHLFKEGE